MVRFSLLDYLKGALATKYLLFSLLGNRMLGIIPLSALFILFDFVIHNPFHPETSTNLALLGVAVGHFSRLDYATGGSLPCSILSDFAHLAHHFVRDELHKRDQGYGTDHTVHTRDNNNARQNVDQGQHLPSAGGSQEHGYLSGQMTVSFLPDLNEPRYGYFS